MLSSKWKVIYSAYSKVLNRPNSMSLFNLEQFSWPIWVQLARLYHKHPVSYPKLGELAISKSSYFYKKWSQVNHSYEFHLKKTILFFMIYKNRIKNCYLIFKKCLKKQTTPSTNFLWQSFSKFFIMNYNELQCDFLEFVVFYYIHV